MPPPNPGLVVLLIAAAICMFVIVSARKEKP